MRAARIPFGKIKAFIVLYWRNPSSNNERWQKKGRPAGISPPGRRVNFNQIPRLRPPAEHCANTAESRAENSYFLRLYAASPTASAPAIAANAAGSGTGVPIR